jgi:FAD/FMN-containing dehydrogenase
MGLAVAAGLVSRGRGFADTPASSLGPPTGVPCDSSHHFKNWSKTIKFRPQQFCKPRSEDEVVAVVKHAMDTHTHVRTQGAGHSFAQLVVTDHTLITLDDMRGAIWTAGNRVTVPGGIRLKNLIKELKARQFGLKNLGSISEQSIAGAFSTGTHGSGLNLGAISTQVMGIRLVDGTGEVKEITEADKDDLAAARINIGALGIITAVTLDCVPFYQLDYAAYVTTFEEILANIDQLAAENDRVVVWWLLMSKKKRDTCVLITKNSLGHPVSSILPNPDTPVGQCKPLSKDLTVLQAMLGKTPKKGFRLLQRCRDDYYKILTIPLLPVYHRECEYAIPADKTVAALTKMRDIVEEGDVTLRLPVELRYVAQDDILLSPCRSGPMAYIGASTLTNSTEVFERFEPLMKSFGGRPHWGKNFTVTQEEFQKTMYPGSYDDFRKVRDKYDPDRVFANTMLTELFP